MCDERKEALVYLEGSSIHHCIAVLCRLSVAGHRGLLTIGIVSSEVGYESRVFSDGKVKT